MTIYTLGDWTVTPGREDEFSAAWHDLATATRRDWPNATAVLLRDREVPNRFVSTGPWESLEDVAAWRGSDVFRDGIERIRPLLDDFTAHTMDLAVSIEPLDGERE